MSRALIVGTLLVVAFTTRCQSVLVPDENLKAEFLTWQFGMFVHFGMATFNDREWANGYEDPATFAPSQLDADQWAEAAQSAGMKYAILTAKHTGGWALWDSDNTTHDIEAFRNNKHGKGDIVREFVDAFRRRGLKVGLYYCFPGDYDGRYGNTLPEGRVSLHGMPPEARGNYIDFQKEQLTELLTRYGPIDVIWIDQYRNHFTSGSEWYAIKQHIRSLQHDCYIIANGARDDSDTDIHSYEYPLDQEMPPAGNEEPAEVSDKIGLSWFWNATQDQSRMKSAEEILRMLKLSNARRANYLLNVAPDTTGLLPAASVQRLRQVGELLKESTL